MPETYDVVIVGGAAMGSSLAYRLMADPGLCPRVLVVEKDPTYRRCASALSAASIRQQFSSPVNIRISFFGIRFLREIGERLAVDGERPDIALREGGYLYLASEAGAQVLEENQVLQAREGADIQLFTWQTLPDRFPWLNTDNLACGTWGRSGEGWFDGWGLLQAFRKKARALGAEYRAGRVIGLDREGDRITALRLEDGERIACRAVVNCAGADGRAVAAMAGVEIPVFAKRRSVFGFTCGERLENFPLLIDTTGVWCRPEGEGFIGGVSPGPGEDDPDWLDDDPSTQEVDWALFEERVWPALAQRVPAFEAIRPGRAWAGPYDMNLLDHNAIVGSAGEPANFYLCNGFSGHGLQQSPAVGRGLAELIVHGRYTTLDLTDLGYERVPTNRPLLERNVI
jgi:FAD-dependent oxidoreductase domain-containing protein 1